MLLQFVELGMVTSIEYNHKPVESARKGQEVCVKIEPIPGETPKMFGRHFDEKDFVISKVSFRWSRADNADSSPAFWKRADLISLAKLINGQTRNSSAP